MWTHQSWQQSFMKSLEQNLAPRWNCNEPQLSPLHCLGSSVLCLTSSPKSLVIPRDTQITPSGCVSSDPLLAFGHDLSFQNWDKVEIMSHFSSEDPNYFFLFMVRYLSEPRCFIVPVSWNTIRVYLHTCCSFIISAYRVLGQWLQAFVLLTKADCLTSATILLRPLTPS